MSFEVSEDFRRYRGLRDLDTTGAVRPGRDHFAQNAAQASFSYRTSPRGTLSLSGSHTLWRFENTLRVDQQSGAAALRYDHLVTERSRLGGMLQFSRQTLEPETGRSRHTDYFNASLTFRYVPEESLLFAASLGPALVRQPKSSSFPDSILRGNAIRYDGSGNPQVGSLGTCPTLPTGEFYDGPGCVFVDFPFPSFLRLGEAIPVTSAIPAAARESWTYFADVQLSKDWENARVTGSYRRDQGANAALGFTTVADTVALTSSWRPLQRLSFYFSTTWENRKESAGPPPGVLLVLLDTLPGSGPFPAVNNLVPVGVRIVPGSRVRSRSSVRYFSVTVGGDYFLKPFLKLEGQLGFGDQDASRRSGFGDSNRFWTRVGLDFEYGPIRW
jgi:hypothetical protein